MWNKNYWLATPKSAKRSAEQKMVELKLAEQKNWWGTLSHWLWWGNPSVSAKRSAEQKMAEQKCGIKIGGTKIGRTKNLVGDPWRNKKWWGP